MFLAKRFQTLERRIDTVAEELSALRREVESSILDADDLRDTARRMLNRANAQRRWIEEKEKNGDPVHVSESLDTINQRIQEGRYP